MNKYIRAILLKNGSGSGGSNSSNGEFKNYLEGKEFKLPSDLTIIGSYAFLIA